MKRISLRLYLSIGITATFGWAITFLAMNVFRNYAVGLFLWLPFVMGISSTIIYAYKNRVTKRLCMQLSFVTLTIFSIGLLFFALEGVICIVMAAPIAFVLNWLGYMLGYDIVKTKIIGSPPTILIVFLLSVPSLMGFEYAIKDNEVEIKTIITAIEINAPAETVWKNVIEFPQLDEPKELLFKTGIAYPINAKIDGEGVGAIRHCNFSTGSFVEPITVWDEPHLLKFNVTEQPEAMKELSIYDIHPAHLHGYFVSKQGQFKLTTLPNGHTLLEGTTWYFNKIKPAFYWTLWSDYIVHKIHERVLKHIKAQSEKQGIS